MIGKIKGGLFGLASGDALGTTLEFSNEVQMNQLHRIYGKHQDFKGGGPFHFEKGEVSDDTDMMLCVAKGIITQPESPVYHMGEAFLKWLETKPKDIGITVLQSLRHYRNYRDWDRASRETHVSLGGKSAGNGSLMRCLPIGLVYTDNRSIVRLSVKQSKLTHYDDKAATCCVLYNHMAKRLMEGEPMREAMEHCLNDSAFLHALTTKPASKPDAYVVHTFEWLCYLLYNTTSYEEAVVEAVNLGYDADTLGATVGGLAGVAYGYENIPSRFKEELLIKEELHRLADDLLRVREGLARQ